MFCWACGESGSENRRDQTCGKCGMPERSTEYGGTEVFYCQRCGSCGVTHCCNDCEETVCGTCGRAGYADGDGPDTGLYICGKCV